MFYGFQMLFLNNQIYWHFLYCFGFNLKKKKIVEKVNIYNQQLNIWRNNWRLHNWQCRRTRLVCGDFGLHAHRTKIIMCEPGMKKSSLYSLVINSWKNCTVSTCLLIYLSETWGRCEYTGQNPRTKLTIKLCLYLLHNSH